MEEEGLKWKVRYVRQQIHRKLTNVPEVAQRLEQTGEWDPKAKSFILQSKQEGGTKNKQWNYKVKLQIY